MTEDPDLHDIMTAIHNGHVGQVGIYCDALADDDVAFEADFTGATAEDRRTAARTFLNENRGWRCDATGDWCPDHKDTPIAQPVPVDRLNGFSTYRDMHVTSVGEDRETYLALGQYAPINTARAFELLARAEHVDLKADCNFNTREEIADALELRWAVFTGLPDDWRVNYDATEDTPGAVPVTVLELT